VLSLLSRADRKDLGSLADFNKPEVKIAIPRGSTAAKAIATYTPKATIRRVFGQRRHDRRARRQPGGRHVQR